MGCAGRESANTYQMIIASDSNHQNSAIRGTCGFCGGVFFPGFASCAMMRVSHGPRDHLEEAGGHTIRTACELILPREHGPDELAKYSITMTDAGHFTMQTGACTIRSLASSWSSTRVTAQSRAGSIRSRAHRIEPSPATR